MLMGAVAKNIDFEEEEGVEERLNEQFLQCIKAAKTKYIPADQIEGLFSANLSVNTLLVQIFCLNNSFSELEQIYNQLGQSLS